MSWNYEARRKLSARGELCRHCDKPEMRAAIYAELRLLVERGQWSHDQLEEACSAYCTGHVNEWIPDFIIKEEV